MLCCGGEAGGGRGVGITQSSLVLFTTKILNIPDITPVSMSLMLDGNILKAESLKPIPFLNPGSKPGGGGGA